MGRLPPRALFGLLAGDLKGPLTVSKTQTNRLALISLLIRVHDWWQLRWHAERDLQRNWRCHCFPHSGNTVTVSHVPNKWRAIITVSCTAGTNYSAPASKTVKAAEFILATLNDNSWAAIHSVLQEQAQATGRSATARL